MSLKDNILLYRSGSTVLSRSFIWFLFCAVFVVVPELFNLQSSIAQHNVLVILNIISYLLCVINWIRRGNRVISLFNFFVLYAMFSGIGQSLFYMFDLVPENFLSAYNDVSFATSINALSFQLICVAALNLGVSYYLRKDENCLSQEELTQFFHDKQSEHIPSVAIIFLYICIIFYIIYGLRMIVTRQSMSYGDFYEERQSWSEWYFGILEYGILFLGIFCLFKKRYVKTIYVVFSFLVCAFMVVGSRSLAIRHLAILILFFPISYPKLFTKRYALFWILGALLFFASLSVISAARNSAFGQSGGINGTLIESSMNTVAEMGLTERPLFIAFEARETGQLPYKQTILYTIVSNVLSNPVAHLIGLGDAEKFTLAGFATRYVGSFYSGLGGSFIGEAYMNYGWFGWIYIMLYGLFIAYAENSAFKKWFKGEYIVSTIFLLFLARQIFYARGDMPLIGNVFRYSTIVLIVYFVLRKPRTRYE